MPRELLRDVARLTPVTPAVYLEPLVTGPVWLKCENLQLAGSFKVRGAYTRMARMPEGDRARGVVAASAGNHAQGVAVAARRLGIDATIFMPVGAPLPKVTATVGYGAHVELVGDTIDEALVHAAEFGDRTGATLIHPFDHEDVVSGQGTVGLEILDQVPDVATVLVCVGGGGLVAGIATTMAALAPHVRVVGVQAEQAAAYPPRWQSGSRSAWATCPRWPTGSRWVAPAGALRHHPRSREVPITTVSEESISRALLMALERKKLLVEPAGAAAVAAPARWPAATSPPRGRRALRRQRRSAAAGPGDRSWAGGGRPLSGGPRPHPGQPRITRPAAGGDRPEAANVESVEHVRTSPDLAVGQVEVLLQLETRGSEHSESVLGALRSAGYRTWVEGRPET